MDYAKLYTGMKQASQMVDNGEIDLTDPDYALKEAKNVGMVQSRRPKARPEKKPSQSEMLLKYFKQIEQMKGMEETRPRARPGTPLPPVDNPLAAAREALGQIESSNNYEAVGPKVEKGMYAGQRAYGKYQVMEGNIGPWTKKVLGKAMSKDEFIKSPAAQDAVAEWKLKTAKNKHGTWEDAASVWFSGQPYDPSSTKSDGFASVPEYVTKFQTAFMEMARTMPQPEDNPTMAGLVRRR